MPDSLLEFLPFLAIPVGLWEARTVQRKYGIPLGLYAGVITGGGIALWLYVLGMIYTEPRMINVWFTMAQIGCFVLAPAATTVYFTRKMGLSAGVFAGVTVGFVMAFFLAWIAIAMYGT